MDPTPARDSSPVETTPVDSLPVKTTPVDLDRVERDLDDVQTALERLNDGDYWTDDVTGAPLSDEFLADNPTARTATAPR